MSFVVQKENAVKADSLKPNSKLAIGDTFAPSCCAGVIARSCRAQSLKFSAVSASARLVACHGYDPMLRFT